MVIGALQATTNIAPTVIGKPERAIFEAAIQDLHADPRRTAMLGDRLETDILGGQRAGITTILVLTGVTTPAYLEKSQIKPDYIYDSIAELAADLRAVALSR
jgi:4-nitrophenyl phosphatase